ncbi:MAG: hypothetical protein UU37_C0001G0024 [Candidatus Gottesmanbacteria bacterium GW2011_GWA2_41_12]|uniref:Uncharacterized protein n=2 Tax=Candidatus Gottesmaniibacteriota TaxID=1752720 RepID=A0A0G0WW17_9BACT|nr:MAG: hypothetical protein UT63_C0005G0018 [Candidatus Gottesmanbacteria bacterium GW2011_GWC2_39_8]KKR88605.1 MAG: hypothetical protein UU37_C0001G0024 [Candidatus Gottesmanbacteria bacterium GW2011_GWA2_41_12]
MKLPVLFLTLLFLLFLFSSSSQIVLSDFSFSDLPNQADDDDELKITASVSGRNKNTIYYIRAAFAYNYPTPSPAYLGYTRNNEGVWYNGKPTIDHTKYFKIVTNDEGNWSGEIFVKVDKEDSDFKGSGDYLFKLGKYTETGNSPDWSDNTRTIINIKSDPTPTLTPIPPTATKIPSPTVTLKPAPSIKVPTVKPSVTIKPDPTSIPTSKLSPTGIYSINNTEDFDDSSVSGEILGLENGLASNSAENKSIFEVSTTPVENKLTNKNFSPAIFGLGGLFFLLSGGSVFVIMKRKSKNQSGGTS